MAQVAQMRDANPVNAKDKNSVFTALQPLAFIVIGGYGVDRDVTNGRAHGPPVLAAGSEPFENHRITLGHVNITVRAVLMAGGDYVLFEGWPRKIPPRVGISEDACALARSNLKRGMAEPFDLDGGRVGRGQSEDGLVDNLDFMAEAPYTARKSHDYYKQQKASSFESRS